MASIMAMLTNTSVFYPLLKLKKAEKLTQGERYCGFQFRHMGSLKAMLEPSNDIYPSSKLKVTVADKKVEKLHVVHADDPHLGFCYSMLPKLSTNLSVLMSDLDTHSRDIACIFFMLLVAMDTIEDDTSIATEIKLPILESFHHHIYDSDWHFSCGTKEYKVLMDNFHHVSSAFITLNKSYQHIIGDTCLRMGAVMAKYICKKVETIDDYEEYCFHVSGLFVIGSTKLFQASQGDILPLESLSKHIGFFFQKTNIIRDYLEDINELPKSRMFWPHEIWSKYANNLEDFKCEKNSEMAVQCLNEMVTDALIHVDGCFQYMSQLRDPAIFRYWAIPQVLAFGTLALCYNNIHVFRRGVKIDRCLRAIVFDRTKTMTDVYGAFYDFSSVIKSKIDINDPNAGTTTSMIESIQKICWDSGSLEEWKSYVVESDRAYLYNQSLVN